MAPKKTTRLDPDAPRAFEVAVRVLREVQSKKHFKPYAVFLTNMKAEGYVLSSAEAAVLYNKAKQEIGPPPKKVGERAARIQQPEGGASSSSAPPQLQIGDGPESQEGGEPRPEGAEGARPADGDDHIDEDQEEQVEEGEQEEGEEEEM